jgi:hypothetical protein
MAHAFTDSHTTPISPLWVRVQLPVLHSAW